MMTYDFDATTVWNFRTANFEVFCRAEPEDYPDLSWADEEVLDRLDRGVYQNICWHVGVRKNGHEIGSSYLGNSVYEDPSDFVREHLGVAPQERAGGFKYITYFPEMVREAIADARKTLAAGLQSTATSPSIE
jgi:hypothetical protein